MRINDCIFENHANIKLSIKESFFSLCKDPLSNDEIDFYIESAIRFIKNYCNINFIPNELASIAAMVAKDIYSGSMEKSSESLKSVKRGDTTVTYKDGKKTDLLSSYYPLLNSFRRLHI